MTAVAAAPNTRRRSRGTGAAVIWAGSGVMPLLPMRPIRTFEDGRPPVRRHRERADSRSDAAGQHEDEDDDQQEPQSAAGVIAPAAAVRPCRQGADQQENQDDQ